MQPLRGDFRGVLHPNYPACRRYTIDPPTDAPFCERLHIRTAGGCRGCIFTTRGGLCRGTDHQGSARRVVRLRIWKPDGATFLVRDGMMGTVGYWNE